MASRFLSLFPQPLNATPSVYAGGKLYFYASGSSEPQSTFSNEGLTVPNANPVIFNSAGYPDVAIFLSNRAYKVVLKDANDNIITTVDPYYVTDFKNVSITKVGMGPPAGSVEGTAGSVGVLATQYWDAQNLTLYFCSVTGVAATAGWTAINASAATPTVTPPQGYLTPTPGTPIITGDAAASTQIGYEPFVGNLVPIYNGSRHIPTEFAALTLDLVSQHALNTIYDVFVFSNSGVLTLVTGPAWSVSTAGSGARGTGAGTTQLTRLSGYWVNAVSMTGRNGSTTYSIGANLATYLGSIFIDGTAGQVTCHRAWGQSRKWGVWNAYNRQAIDLVCGDGTSSWNYNTNTVRQSRATAGNTLAVLAGLAEELVSVRFVQKCKASAATAAGACAVGIGVNVTNAFSGKVGSLALNNTSNDYSDLVAEHAVVPFLGIQNINALENTPVTGGASNQEFFGGEDDMRLSARWFG